MYAVIFVVKMITYGYPVFAVAIASIGYYSWYRTPAARLVRLPGLADVPEKNTGGQNHQDDTQYAVLAGRIALAYPKMIVVYPVIV